MFQNNKDKEGGFFGVERALGTQAPLNRRNYIKGAIQESAVLTSSVFFFQKN